MSLLQREALPVDCNVIRANSERWTFECTNTHNWTVERMDGCVLNACAGETKLKYDGQIHRNDANEDRPADTHMDLRELPGEVEKYTYDTVVYDPPWSVFQVNDKYDGVGQDTIKQSTQMAKAIDKMLKPGGKVISFGYTIDMIPSSFDYSLQEAAIFTIPGPGKDFLGSVHMKGNNHITKYGDS